MDTWETIRIRCRRDGEKIKPVARDLGLAPNTVRKYLRQDGPPKRKPRPRAKLLDRYVTHIDELIRTTPKSQRCASGAICGRTSIPNYASTSVRYANILPHDAPFLY